jgi:hypothetical protein
MRSRRWLYFTAVLLALLTSCRRSAPLPPGEIARQSVEAHARLKLTYASPFTAVHEELARIEGESGLPQQMSARRIASDEKRGGWQRGERLLPDEENAALAALAAIPVEQQKFLRNSLNKLYPQGPLRFNGVEIRRVRELLYDYRAQRDAYQAAIQRPQCDFAFRFNQGLLADLAAIDAALLGNRLLVLAGADALYDGNTLAAAKLLPDLFRVAAWLDEQRNMTAAAAAARLRYEALRLVEALVQHPATTPKMIQQCHDLLARHTAALPDDGQAWIGERSIGLHAYEMVRAGEILSLLTDEEMNRAVQQGVDAYTAAVFESIEQDELFYLASMRRMISGCDLPYYDRLSVLQQLERDLEDRRGGKGEPLVAGLLLRDFQQAHLTQGRDRAAMQAWTLLLAAASGRELATAQPNPLTGEPFEVRIGTRVELDGLVLPREDEWWQQPLIAPLAGASR